MCLIIVKPASVDFADNWLRDFWLSNRDGVGIMRMDGIAVDVRKIVAPSCDEWIQFYNDFARGRECVIHLRMRTHGRIDADNTHPYYIGRGYYLVHNGVLASGNAADRSKSDTWHFIKDVIKPALRNNSRVLENALFLKEIAGKIGPSNRMVVLGPNGISKILNKSSGVVWRGAWFSNTYAWSAPLIGDKIVQRADVQPPHRFGWGAMRDEKIAKSATPKPQPKPAAPAPMIHKAVVVPKPDAPRYGPHLRVSPVAPSERPRYLRPSLWLPTADELDG